MRKDKYYTTCGALVSALAGAAFLVGIVEGEGGAPARTAVRGTASWYSRKECCTPRNPNALMANGKPLDDNALTCASWFYPFGTRLRVRHQNRSVLVTVTDRGPAKRLVKKGRLVDLTRAAFSRLAPLTKGLISVTVEEAR